MAFAKIYSAQNHLLKAHLISVEVDISRGLHAFSIVGLPDKAIEESRDRVSAAIKNSGFKSPRQTNAKIVVSLAPADIRKEGPAFDLPIALGYLAANGEIEIEADNDGAPKRLFVGELALDGTVRPVTGTLSFARMAVSHGFTEIFVPQENTPEAAAVENLIVYGVRNLQQVMSHINKVDFIPKTIKTEGTPSPDLSRDGSDTMDFDDIIGQESAKRALTIAAAGRHNIGLFGPPGTGKTMLARALQSIMPLLSPEESLEVTEIYSASGNLREPFVSRPPVRKPHHTSSYTSMIGGGSVPRPGEITLAHRGILFMDVVL